MKIAMYAPSWPPADANGVVTYLSYMIPEIRRCGHEVYVITPVCLDASDPYTIDLNRFIVRQTLKDRLLYKISLSIAHQSEASQRLARSVRYLVEHHGVEILEIEEAFGLSKAISDLNIIPVVVRLHGPWFLNKRISDTRREDINREIKEREAISAADVVTAPSQYVRDAVIERYFSKRPTNEQPKIMYLPNPIVTPTRQWHLADCDRNNLLFVGRFDTIKGGDLVVRAFGELAKTMPALRLTFVGPDNGVDGLKFREFANQHLSADAISRIAFVGAIARSKIDDLRLKSFITLFASRVEVFGYTLLEAMALGCPIVASATGGAAALIGDSGVRFESGNLSELISGIRSLLSDGSKASELGANAKLRAALFSPESVVVHTLDCYRRTILGSQAIEHCS